MYNINKSLFLYVWPCIAPYTFPNDEENGSQVTDTNTIAPTMTKK